MSNLTDVFERITRPERAGLSPEHARYILSLTFCQADKDRAEMLSYKAQDGALSEKETYELDTLLAVNSFLIILHAKARLSLKTS